MSDAPTDAPPTGRADAGVQGYRLLARLGKRVLRPGGVELTRGLLERAGLPNSDVVELAPGMGRTATEILTHQPRSYLGVEKNPDAVQATQDVVGGGGTVRVGDAAQTGLPPGSADVIVAEALLSMQGDDARHAIVNEVARVLRPGGRYAIHEVALTPNSISEDARAEVRQALASSVKDNARLLTVAEWMQLLAEHELVVDVVSTAPIAMLEPRRLVADEGLSGALRFAKSLLAHRGSRRQVRAMRRTFRAERARVAAVGILAHKPGGGANPAVSKGKGCC